MVSCPSQLPMNTVNKSHWKGKDDDMDTTIKYTDEKGGDESDDDEVDDDDGGEKKECVIHVKSGIHIYVIN
jgi:hypothetical protein